MVDVLDFWVSGLGSRSQARAVEFLDKMLKIHAMPLSTQMYR